MGEKLSVNRNRERGRSQLWSRPRAEQTEGRSLPRRRGVASLLSVGVVAAAVGLLPGEGSVVFRGADSRGNLPHAAGEEPALPADGSLFTEMTAVSGITFQHSTGDTGRLLYPEIMGSGVALFDYDGDADLDIYFLNGNFLRGKPHDPKLTNVLYRNDGGWRFTDVTYEAGVADSGYGQGAEAADFDNDGDLDLYITNVGPNVYFQNNGDGTFTRTSLLADERWGQCCSALDYDNDGDLDLYLVNYVDYDPATQVFGTIMVAGKLIHDYQGPENYRGSPDVLFRNNGDGTFSDVTKALGLYQPGGRGMGVACADFDNDGDADIFVANDFMENHFFVNEGGRFREAALSWGVSLDGHGHAESFMGVDAADVDGDGRLDMLVPCLATESFNLFRNEGSAFSDASVTSGVYEATSGRTGFSPNFFDYDNDGDMDAYVTTGRVLSSEESVRKGWRGFSERYAQPDLLLGNDGQGRFRDVSQWAGPYFQKAYVARGSAVGDLDNDGDIDVVINNSAAPPALLRNNNKSGHWLTLRLVGTRSNRDGIGAWVVARTGGRSRFHYVRGGGSYLSVSDRRVHLGLGNAALVEEIEITWPSRTRQVVKNIRADQFITVEEPLR